VIDPTPIYPWKFKITRENGEIEWKTFWLSDSEIKEMEEKHPDINFRWYSNLE